MYETIHNSKDMFSSIYFTKDTFKSSSLVKNRKLITLNTIQFLLLNV